VNETPQSSGSADSHADIDFQALFHRLNNHLGILLAQAELLGAKPLTTTRIVCAPRRW
jgi:hypothetical protein